LNQFNPPELTIESFESYVDMLETEAKRTIVSVETNSNDLGLDAFLREGSKRSDATSEDRKTFERRLCAHCILSSIDNLANGIDITKNKHLAFVTGIYGTKKKQQIMLYIEKNHTSLVQYKRKWTQFEVDKKPENAAKHECSML